MNKKTHFILAVIVCLSLFLNFYKKSSVPACLNADEAAFGYNAYSILQTGKDEYGQSFPLRLKSFGDYKLPLYSYVSIPFIQLFSLTDLSSRLANSLVAVLLPFTVFLLAKQFFRKNSIALISAFLVSVSVGLQLISRQAHEAYITAFLVCLATLFFVRLQEKYNWINLAGFLSALLLSLFSYQSSRIFAAFFLFFTIFYLIRKKIKLGLLIGLVATIGLFGLTDLIYKPERVKNLLFFNSRGFVDQIQELRMEGGSRLFHNKATVAVKNIIFKYFEYFSPQLLVINGDSNLRFGYKGMSPISPIEYLFVLIGFYYLFKNKEKWRFFLVILILISILPAVLTWVDLSITRSLFVFIPLLIIVAYGLVNLIEDLNKKYRMIVIMLVLFLEIIFLGYSWDFYFNHYPKRAAAIRSWQCGYKELASYIKDKYDKFDKFYITRKNGQPYIFLLYYLQYSPEKYQAQANLSKPDVYGFGQVENFDKFHFKLLRDFKEKSAVYIGFPDDFRSVPLSSIKKIKIGTEEIFWIYERPI